jgi:hypothetical protein
MAGVWVSLEFKLVILAEHFGLIHRLDGFDQLPPLRRLVDGSCNGGRQSWRGTVDSVDIHKTSPQQAGCEPGLCHLAYRPKTRKL